MNLVTKFDIDQYVNIKPLNFKGQIIGISFNRRVSYEVCYYWNCESKKMYVWEDELERLENEKKVGDVCQK